MNVVIADRGRSFVSLEVCSDAPATVSEAGRVFCDVFEKITGTAPLEKGAADARFSVRLSPEKVPGSRADVEGIDLGEEGYALFFDGKTLTLTGSPVRGILFGVYALFEKYFGCRWFSDKDVLIPKRNVLTLPGKIDDYSVPDMVYRRFCNPEGRYPAFCLANGLNNTAGRIPPEQGGQVEVALGLCHTIDWIIPDTLFDEHPEYFPLIGGERVKGQHMQRCLTNPDVLAITIQKTKELLAQNPDAKYVGISQSDTYPNRDNSCECPACRAIEEEEGSKAGLWIRFLNKISDAIADEFPDRGLETLAYRFTRKPPKTAPRANIMITLCSIECCFSHKMDECQIYKQEVGGRSGNRLFLEDLSGWAKLSSNILIWDYVTDFSHYMLPFPNLHTFAHNMRLYYDNGVRGYYPEGAHDRFGAEMSTLKGYLLAKLAWDRFYDVETGMKEFVGYYCGAGAPFILDYIHALNDRAEQLQYHFCCYEAPSPVFFDRDFLAFANACFDRAEALAENDDVLDRIRYWRMSVRYAELTCGAKEMGRDEAYAACDAFFADMKRFGIESTCEGGSFDGSVNRMKEQIERQLNDD